jgi:hypothetical protein
MKEETASVYTPIDSRPDAAKHGEAIVKPTVLAYNRSFLKQQQQQTVACII